MSSTENSQALYSQSTIRENIQLEAVIPRVREAFVEFNEGRAQMPAKNYLLFEEANGDLRTMSAYVETFNLATVKLVNSHPNNPTKHKLPTVMALLAVFDPDTGQPIALMDATELTKLRTASATALATEQLTPDSVEALGVVGAGAQATSQIRGQLWARDFQVVRIFDLNPDQSHHVIAELDGEFPDVQFEISESVPDLLTKSQVVVSLTPGTQPLVESVKSSINHVNAIGADGPGKREWPDEFLRNSRVIVDNWEQAQHSGEIQRLADKGELIEDTVFANLGDVLAGQKSILSEQTVFDSTGLAIQDTACARAVLDTDLTPDARFNFFS